mmetsp:Transcript_1896/g.5031  ORF Transcript_1896/g.5031 Transcript_1896/m.5031 type:complete len:221 (+) Transcript_1896:1636-2298(+)
MARSPPAPSKAGRGPSGLAFPATSPAVRSCAGSTPLRSKTTMVRSRLSSCTTWIASMPLSSGCVRISHRRTSSPIPPGPRARGGNLRNAGPPGWSHAGHERARAAQPSGRLQRAAHSGAQSSSREASARRRRSVAPRASSSAAASSPIVRSSRSSSRSARLAGASSAGSSVAGSCSVSAPCTEVPCIILGPPYKLTRAEHRSVSVARTGQVRGCLGLSSV